MISRRRFRSSRHSLVSPVRFPGRISSRSANRMNACSFLPVIYGSTALIAGVTPLPLRTHTKAGLALPPGFTARDIFPPTSDLHRSKSGRSTDDAPSVGTQDDQPYRVTLQTMNEPSPSRNPASHAASTSLIPGHNNFLYSGNPLNPEYVAMSRRRLEGVAPMFAKETA